jgi:hypothetical protein
MNKENIESSLWEIFYLGQEYWRLADSDSYKNWKKSDLIKEKVISLISEIINFE